MNKYDRHLAILQIIKDYEIQTQEELAVRLMENGIYATQATISRDIRELRLVKVLSRSGIYKYSTGAAESIGDMEHRLSTIFEKSVVSVQNAGNIVVVKTLSGMAQAAASALDSMDYCEILGCIAGDDTIMAVTPSAKDSVKVASRLKSMIK